MTCGLIFDIIYHKFGRITILFYNWPKIYRVAEGKVENIYRILKMLVYKEIPKNKYDPIYYYHRMNFRGYSFLLHPDVLLYNSYKYKTKDVVIYTAIASLRPYADYIAYGISTLPNRFCPVKLEEYMADSELLTIDDEDNIHFLYEELSP